MRCQLQCLRHATRLIQIHLSLQATKIDPIVASGLQWVHVQLLATHLDPTIEGLLYRRSYLKSVKQNASHNSCKNATHTNDVSKTSFSILTNFFSVALPQGAELA